MKPVRSGSFSKTMKIKMTSGKKRQKRCRFWHPLLDSLLEARTNSCLREMAVIFVLAAVMIGVLFPGCDALITFCIWMCRTLSVSAYVPTMLAQVKEHPDDSFQLVKCLLQAAGTAFIFGITLFIQRSTRINVHEIIPELEKALPFPIMQWRIKRQRITIESEERSGGSRRRRRTYKNTKKHARKRVINACCFFFLFV